MMPVNITMIEYSTEPLQPSLPIFIIAMAEADQSRISAKDLVKNPP